MNDEFRQPRLHFRGGIDEQIGENGEDSTASGHGKEDEILSVGSDHMYSGIQVLETSDGE